MTTFRKFQWIHLSTESMAFMTGGGEQDDNDGNVEDDDDDSEGQNFYIISKQNKNEMSGDLLTLSLRKLILNAQCKQGARFVIVVVF